MSVTEISGRPLLTLALIAYNQERYIREAVASAFAQTYTPLEIILSDDCSSDGTFEIMRSMVEAYSGPHQVRLNRNEFNAGIGSHVTKLFELARGELVLLAAGDDISLPERARINHEAWEASERKAHCVYSGYSIIGPRNQELHNTGMEFKGGNDGRTSRKEYSVVEFLGPNKPIVFGCAAAWSPQLMKGFGPLPATVVHEDEVLGLRTACLGLFCCVASPLVKYRLHDENVFGAVRKSAGSAEEIARRERRSLRELETRLGMYDAFIADLATARDQSMLAPGDLETALEICRSRQVLLQRQLEFHRSSFVRKVGLLITMKNLGLSNRDLRLLASRLLPSTVLLKLKYWRGRMLARTAA